MTPTRENALALLLKYTHTESLIKHALSVEAVMRHFAALHGEDPEKWGVIGLIHDLDYEQFPEQHCTMTRRILQEEGWPEEYIRAVEKWALKNFAAGANREVIEQGARMMGEDLDRVIAETITGMKNAAEAIGLAGTPVDGQLRPPP